MSPRPAATAGRAEPGERREAVARGLPGGLEPGARGEAVARALHGGLSPGTSEMSGPGSAERSEPGDQSPPGPGLCRPEASAAAHLPDAGRARRRWCPRPVGGAGDLSATGASPLGAAGPSRAQCGQPGRTRGGVQSAGRAESGWWCIEPVERVWRSAAARGDSVAQRHRRGTRRPRGTTRRSSVPGYGDGGDRCPTVAPIAIPPQNRSRRISSSRPPGVPKAGPRVAPHAPAPPRTAARRPLPGSRPGRG